MSEDLAPTDLFGEPARPAPEKRGRRRLRYPAEVYEKVEVLAAGNLSQDEIADAIGISAPTLRKYFRKELNNGLARQEAESLELLAKAARGGNVSAIKAWREELAKQRAGQSLRERERPTRAAPRKGVKQERLDAAAGVASSGGKYSPRPMPRLLIDNDA